MTLPEWLDGLDPRPDVPTREQGVKWVIVLDRDLPRGLQVNAAACLAAAVGRAAPAILGEPGLDADGGAHSGLPWTGCTVLAAPAAIVRAIRAEAVAAPDLLVTDMAAIAQRAGVYLDYLAELGRSRGDDLDYYAIGILGPRSAVDRLTARLPLLR
ncbi:DUF2000 domain-containing protein [Thermocatellispora tengchongensis]|nr:DUF2000 domain-containing protein [Thermocatellispora tengchongensis]